MCGTDDDQQAMFSYVSLESRVPEDHPAMVMDMSFANQALSAEYVVKNYRKLQRRVYVVPAKIDAEIARLKLKSMGIPIDRLTPEQKKYLSSWEMGT